MSDERYYKNYPERETEQDEAPKPDAQYYAGKDEEGDRDSGNGG